MFMPVKCTDSLTAEEWAESRGGEEANADKHKHTHTQTIALMTTAPFWQEMAAAAALLDKY